MARRILLVDDEKDMLFMLRFRLEAAGYAVVSAGDGIEGYTCALREKPDIILLDVLLPGIDGLQLCRKLKDTEELRRIPVLILTASNVKDVERRSSEAGADGCLKKPFDSLELLNKIKFLLGDSEAQVRAGE